MTFFAERKIKYYLAGFIVFAMLFAGLFYFVGTSAKETVKSAAYTAPGFDSRARISKLKEKEYFETQDSSLKELNVGFSFNAYSISNWNNIFQTADENHGVRLELGSPSGMSLVIGADSDSGLKGYTLTDSLNPGEWYSFKLNISPEKRIKAFLNDKKVLDIKDPSLDYRISHIAVGTGFSKTRPFDGRVKEFSISYHLMRFKSDDVFTELYGRPFFLLLAVLLGGLAIFFFYKYGDSAVGRKGDYSLEKNEKVFYMGFVILAGFVAAVIYHYWMGVYLSKPYPFNTFLFNPQDRFNDFFVMYDLDKGFNAYTHNLINSQFPFLNLVAALFALISRDASLFLYIAVVITGFSYFNFVFIRGAKNTITWVFIFSLLTYPLLFTLDRANLEGLVFIFLALFIYFYWRRHFMVSSIFLGAAIAMKVFPVVFLVLFLSDRKYKEMFAGIAAAVIFSAGALLALNGSFFKNLNEFLSTKNFDIYSAYLGPKHIVQRGVNIFSVLKIYLIHFKMIAKTDMTQLLNRYAELSVVFFAGLAAYVVFVEKEFWKKVAILVISMLLLPQLSGDYKLIHLFLPLFLFINAPKGRQDLFYALAFGLLLIPKDYWMINEVVSDGGQDISWAVIINVAIMVIMLAVIVIEGLLRARKKTYEITN